MKILAIDTSCDETACAITENTTILSSVVWSQASLHTKWGGVLPSLAKREHEKRIGFVVEKALSKACSQLSTNIDAVAVTVGPGLAIALEVGIKKAKELSEKFNKPLILINHIEGHVLSSLAQPNSSRKIDPTNINYPAIGLVTSGKHTELIYIEKVGKYKILAQTVDDALGEALDKAARMLGFGYPGAAILEKMAREGNPKKYKLPIPLFRQEERMIFSYSGLKTAMFRKTEELKNEKGVLTKTIVCDLAASFQESAFNHFLRVFEYSLKEKLFGGAKQILAGGGVMANTLLRKKIKILAKNYGLKVYYPYTKKLYGDNAAMIGVVAFFKAQRNEFEKEIEKVDRTPNLKIDNEFI